WNYGAGVASRKRLSPRNEKVLWFLKDPKNYTFNLDLIRDPNVKYPNQKKNGKLKCNPLGKNPSDVWQIAKVTSGKNRSSKERAPHPAQFPLELINRLMNGFSNEEEIVLDPFLGSGTTAESSMINGRYVIGIEINKEYLLYAKNRLQRKTEDISLTLAQQPLLV
ncbi:site-specific DNA-methyltransferase, partial [Escherichia coli]|nr:site-specific DNA-methyltransferase [Escherichia coli]